MYRVFNSTTRLTGLAFLDNNRFIEFHSIALKSGQISIKMVEKQLQRLQGTSVLENPNKRQKIQIFEINIQENIIRCVKNHDGFIKSRSSRKMEHLF
jgi:hypothetical protein